MQIDQNRLYKLIDKILWEDWDPIGVNDNKDARDEYQSYITPIIKLIESHKSQKQLQDYLYTIETVNMELKGDPNRCETIANKIFNIINKSL